MNPVQSDSQVLGTVARGNPDTETNTRQNTTNKTTRQNNKQQNKILNTSYEKNIEKNNSNSREQIKQNNEPKGKFQESVTGI